MTYLDWYHAERNGSLGSLVWQIYHTQQAASLHFTYAEINICSEFKSILEEIGFLVLVQTLIISHCPCLFERSQRETSEDCPRYWYLMKIELIQNVIPGLKS